MFVHLRLLESYCNFYPFLAASQLCSYIFATFILFSLLLANHPRVGVSLSQKLSSPSTPSTIYGYRSRSPSKRSRQPEDDDECSPSPTKRPSVDTNMPHIPVINNSFMNLPPRFPIAHRTAIEYPPASLGSGISISPQTLKHHLQSPNDQQSPNNQEPQVETHQCDPHSQALSLPEVPAVPSSPGVHADDGPTLIRTTQLGRSVKAQQASVSVQGDLEHMKRGWYVFLPAYIPFFPSNRSLGVGLRRSIGRDVALSSSGNDKLALCCIFLLRQSHKTTIRKIRS